MLANQMLVLSKSNIKLLTQAAMMEYVVENVNKYLLLRIVNL